MSETRLPTALEPFPEPDAVQLEVLDEWAWILQERGEGRFDEYGGMHVAVVNRTVLGSSLDPNLLEKYLAKTHNINPRRIVIFFVEGWLTREDLYEPYPERDPLLEEEVLEEWRWVLQERSKGRFDEYAGMHVAVVNRTVLGSSLDPNLLEKYLAETHNINPRRIVIFFVEGW